LKINIPIEEIVITRYQLKFKTISLDIFFLKTRISIDILS
jgi:hypothetical protein